MSNVNEISEVYRKYLIKYTFGNVGYYSVVGADTSLEDAPDKIMVDQKGDILLFRTPLSLYSFISSHSYFFDNETLQKWVDRNNMNAIPYAQINLDALISEKILDKNVDVFEEIFSVLGMVKDYAQQVQNALLLNILEGEIICQLNDKLADYYLWKEVSELVLCNDVDLISKVLREVYLQLSARLYIIG
ncbi:hypothetical protein MKQ68_14360 [Chitinophaga horti]|uniref:Uncharacterized protein n=1 Tax=Chitinophaga horti TaxID=2920382 RepID=A0ABY6IV68_9BACT|nr:hypothetical protein [Chitinophaga horti]UYQ91272.1 hypothetical protein MKQ68_14360 [Chitinophaga horti]